MSAETLLCPNCGAPAATDAPGCAYCNARLATVACPSCFGMMFVGHRHCPRCGAAAERAASAPSNRPCPRCHVPMAKTQVGDARLSECPRCQGLWVDVATFESICANRETQAAVLGVGAGPKPMTPTATAPVNYIPCPDCASLMNRINFARCSGVIVDVCKGHGTWFDRNELTLIIEFIRKGGLEVSRQKQKAEWEQERRRLEEQRRDAVAAGVSAPVGATPPDVRIGIEFAGWVIKSLFS